VDRDFADLLWGWGAALVIVLVFVIGGILTTSASCHQKWARSGYQVEWGLFEGCVISADQGHVWIPADAYKELKHVPVEVEDR